MSKAVTGQHLFPFVPEHGKFQNSLVLRVERAEGVFTEYYTWETQEYSTQALSHGVHTSVQKQIKLSLRGIKEEL